MSNAIEAVMGNEIEQTSEPPALARESFAAGVPRERHVMSLRVGQCDNIVTVTKYLLIAAVLIVVQPLLPRLLALLPAFPYQPAVVWGVYVALIALPIAKALYEIARAATFRIEITNQAIRIRRGVFNHQHDHVALFRYRDHVIYRPFIHRLFRRGTIEVLTSDRSSNVFVLPAVKHPVNVAETLNKLATEARAVEGVHVIE